ncbi:MAG: hypothetical protein ABI597_11920 [Gammaproteobacteria bacterium]
MPSKNFINFNTETRQLDCQDEWNIANLIAIKKRLEEVEWPTTGNIIINGQSITKKDTAGAWLLVKWIEKLSAKKLKVTLENFSEQSKKLLEFSKEQKQSPKKIPSEEKEKLNWLKSLGKYSLEQASEQ